MMKDHQGINLRQCIDFGRERVLFASRRALLAPMIDSLFEFCKSEFHAHILRAAYGSGLRRIKSPMMLGKSLRRRV